MRLPNRILLSARNSQCLFPSSFTAEGGKESGTQYHKFWAPGWLPIHNESTCGADASVLHGLMRACTCMCSHIIWAWWLSSVTMLNNAMGMTDDRSTKVGHYIATLAVVAS